MSDFGAVFYDGPSLLTGDRVIGALSGLEMGSANAKTGPMVQAWILRADMAPMDAKRANVDDAVCGDCKLRGRDGRNSACYVVTWQAPFNVWKQVQAGNYHQASWPDLHALLEGRSVRLGAYGDPAAIPFEVWRQLLTTTAGWVGYSHAWRICDPRFKTIVMASVDTVDEFHAAHLAGWRTFRIRLPHDPLLVQQGLARGSNQHRDRPASAVPLEFVCPASDEAGHRSTCQRCLLCRGTSSPARSVAIVAHGKPSSLRVFGLKAPSTPPRRIVKVCAQCGADFTPTRAYQRRCESCFGVEDVPATPVLAEQPRVPCPGGCGRTVLAARPDHCCPDCTLLRSQDRMRERAYRHRQRIEAIDASLQS